MRKYMYITKRAMLRGETCLNHACAGVCWLICCGATNMQANALTVPHREMASVVAHLIDLLA